MILRRKHVSIQIPSDHVNFWTATGASSRQVGKLHSYVCSKPEGHGASVYTDCSCCTVPQSRQELGVSFTVHLVCPCRGDVPEVCQGGRCRNATVLPFIWLKFVVSLASPFRRISSGSHFQHSSFVFGYISCQIKYEAYAFILAYWHSLYKILGRFLEIFHGCFAKFRFPYATSVCKEGKTVLGNTMMAYGGVKCSYTQGCTNPWCQAALATKFCTFYNVYTLHRR